MGLFRSAGTPMVRMVLALLAGFCVSLSFAPVGFWPALPAGFLLHWHLLSRTETLKGTAGLGFCFGLGWFLPGLHWVLRSIVDFGGVPFVFGVAGLVLFALFLSLSPVFAALFAVRWRSMPAAYFLLALPLTHTFMEAVRTDVVRFGWLAPAYATLDTWWRGWAPVGGVDGIHFAFFFCVGAVLYAVVTREWISKALSVAGLAAMVAAGWGLLQIEWSVPGASTWFRLVQPGLIVTNRPNVAENAGRLEYVTDFVKAPWPQESAGHRATLLTESVITVPITSLPREDFERLATLTARADSPVLFAGLRYEHQSVFNTAFWLGEKGMLSKVDKRRLVPFGEYVPGLLRWLPELFGVRIGDMTPGASEQPLQKVGDANVATLICFENLFGTLLPDLFAEGDGPTHLAVISNLGWFADAAKPQHLDISRLRALEAARPVLSVNNNGDSAVIDERGRVILRLPEEGGHVATVLVHGTQGTPTPFVRWGGFLRALLYLTVLLILFSLGQFSRKARRLNRL